MNPEIHRLINTVLILFAMVLISGGLYSIFRLKQCFDNISTVTKLHDKYSVKEDSIYSVVVQKMICKLKYDLHATKVVIGRFHNGGNYVNGLPMKKFTLTHETAGGTGEPMMDKCVAVLNSRYSEAFAQLATLDEYCISDIEDCPDLNFKRDMDLYGYKSTFLFLMRQFDGREDGFVGINFKQTHVMSMEDRHNVREQIIRIIGLLNMEKSHLKGD